ncbi:MAG: FAD-dependent oxidoreductase [Cyanobacteriota bacterium]
MNKHLVIIGAVAAGTKVASKVRREDENIKITLYTKDEHISYAGCGLPYYISDDVKSKADLVVRTPDDFKAQHNIDINIKHEVTHIDTSSKEIYVKDLVKNTEFIVNYDTLVIATGARPFIPPIEGKDLKYVFNLRNVNDAVSIKNLIDSGNVNDVVIIGGGLIGMETAEAFHKRGLNVTVVELIDQILGPIDKDMADIVEEHCVQKGLTILTSDGVKKIVGNSAGEVTKIITNNAEIKTDMVLMSIGVRPNIEIAKEAGIEIGETKTIKVNSRMQTNIPDIYAAGDCVESMHIVTGKPVWIPLGSVANKQGRVAAINITGGEAEFPGVAGSLIVKVFDLNVAKTGLSEKEALKLGYNYEVVTIKGKDKAGYYPGNKNMTIKLLAEKESQKILGCQIVGEGQVDKRIDVIVMALTSNMRLDDLINIDFAYAPPYSSAIEIIVVAAMQLQSKMDKVSV